MANSKILALVIFFTTFVGIVLYVYTGKERTKRLESYRYVPFLDDDDDNSPKPHAEQAAPQQGEK
ncbi:MAG: cbb3-type cytochrome c oxidase subunit 3 [Thiolinea sp.]